jgi:hypothetical protein
MGHHTRGFAAGYLAGEVASDRCRFLSLRSTRAALSADNDL